MKGHSSFVSCILSFSLTTISETSIMGFYYLSICVVIKLGFINRQAVYISNLLYCLGSVLLQKLKIKSERERLSSRGHCLIFIHLAEIIFSLCLSFQKLGRRKRILPTVLGFSFFCFFFFFHFHQLFWQVSYMSTLSIPNGTIVCTLMLNISRF